MLEEVWKVICGFSESLHNKVGVWAAIIYWSVIICFVAILLEFLAANWLWLVAGAVLVAIAYAIYATKKDAARVAKEERAVAQREANDKRYCSELASFSKKYLREFSNYLVECLVIDSNIWMNEDYDDFFTVLEHSCRSNNYKIVLFLPHFEEIEKVKAKYEYETAKSKRSRMASNRIEQFQVARLLDVQPITFEAERFPYADPATVKIVNMHAERGVPCCFISDDRDLRIRLRQHLIDNAAKSNWDVVYMENVLPKCKKVSRAVKQGLV